MNPAINPTLPGTLPPAAGTTNRNDLPGVRRRTNVPPTLLRSRTNITPAQRVQINRLAAELGMFRIGMQLGPQQRNQLMNALTAAGNPASPLPQASLQSLSDHLIAALSGLNLTSQQRQQAAVDLNMLLHSTKLAPSDTQMVIEDARNLLQTAGVNAEAIDTLTADFLTISQALRTGRPATTTSSSLQTPP